ncbi:uncharacterized protein METZ01_LOCUS135507 [marine metagenome]|uniref:Uncharacterized protein n=1 Tax=marine metagenome TaxID=408172 RepID=A0A381Z1G2_9ZZZZ|tara:strand:- start:20140 stop:20667 length:528 start_codon:yes stop_codon:yes gene_type:complete
MSCDLCEECQRKRQIKYTEVEDINNLINEFSGNITGENSITKNDRKTKMYMDIYDLYYDYIGENLVNKFYDLSENWKDTLEWFEDEDLEEEVYENLGNNQIMINIYNEYLPVDCYGFNLFDGDARNSIIEKIHDAYYELEREIMIDVFYEIQKLFSGRIKNKNFLNFFTSLSIPA